MDTTGLPVFPIHRDPPDPEPAPAPARGPSRRWARWWLTAAALFYLAQVVVLIGWAVDA